MYLNKVLSLSVINVSQPESGMAALAGLPAYLELAIVSGLNGSIQPIWGVHYKGARLDVTITIRNGS